MDVDAAGDDVPARRVDGAIDSLRRRGQASADGGDGLAVDQDVGALEPSALTTVPLTMSVRIKILRRVQVRVVAGNERLWSSILPAGPPADRAPDWLDASVYRLRVKTSTKGATSRP